MNSLLLFTTFIVAKVVSAQNKPASPLTEVKFQKIFPNGSSILNDTWGTREFMYKNRVHRNSSKAHFQKAKHHQYFNTTNVQLTVHPGDLNSSSPKNICHASNV